MTHDGCTCTWFLSRARVRVRIFLRYRVHICVRIFVGTYVHIWYTFVPTFVLESRSCLRHYLRHRLYRRFRRLSWQCLRRRLHLRLILVEPNRSGHTHDHVLSATVLAIISNYHIITLSRYRAIELLPFFHL